MYRSKLGQDEDLCDRRWSFKWYSDTEISKCTTQNTGELLNVDYSSLKACKRRLFMYLLSLKTCKPNFCWLIFVNKQHVCLIGSGFHKQINVRSIWFIMSDISTLINLYLFIYVHFSTISTATCESSGNIYLRDKEKGMINLFNQNSQWKDSRSFFCSSHF